jgi:hypothetical protein
MNVMYTLDELDEPKAALRVLMELSSNAQGMNVTWLYRVMKEAYGVGRPAVDTSYKALMRVGLAEMYETKGAGSRKVKVVMLTSLGHEVESKVREIGGIIGDAGKES